jgi:hypothetical protein
MQLIPVYRQNEHQAFSIDASLQVATNALEYTSEHLALEELLFAAAFGAKRTDDVIEVIERKGLGHPDTSAMRLPRPFHQPSSGISTVLQQWLCHKAIGCACSE